MAAAVSMSVVCTRNTILFSSTIAAYLTCGILYRFPVITFLSESLTQESVTLPLGTATDCPEYWGEYELEAFTHFISMHTDRRQRWKSAHVRHHQFDRSILPIVNDSSGIPSLPIHLSRLNESTLHIEMLVRAAMSQGYAVITNDMKRVENGNATARAKSSLRRDFEFREHLTAMALQGCKSPDMSMDRYICDCIDRRLRHPFVYKITDISKKRQSDGCSKYRLTLMLHEFQNGNLTKGGSSFRISMTFLATGSILQCHTRDLFNGTYHVSCPCINGCYILTINHLFHDFLAFTGHYSDVWIPTGTDVVWSSKTCQSHCPDSALSGWRYKHGTWLWYEGNVPAKIRMFSLEERACLEKLTAITLIGSSHLRYIYNYLEVRLYGNIQNLEENASMKHGKLSYYRATYAWRASRHVSRLRVRAGHVVVFMTGAWDLEFTSLENFIKTSDQLVQDVKRLSASSANVTGYKLIWVKSLPYPEKFYERRNNPMILAANAHLSRQFRGLGLAEVDAYTMVEARNNESVREAHYFATLRGTDMFVGSVGYIYVNALINKMCGFES